MSSRSRSRAMTAYGAFETLAPPRENACGAPIPAVRGGTIEPPESTQLRHWPRGFGASATLSDSGPWDLERAGAKPGDPGPIADVLSFGLGSDFCEYAPKPEPSPDFRTEC